MTSTARKTNWLAVATGAGTGALVGGPAGAAVGAGAAFLLGKAAKPAPAPSLEQELEADAEQVQYVSAQAGLDPLPAVPVPTPAPGSVDGKPRRILTFPVSIPRRSPPPPPPPYGNYGSGAGSNASYFPGGGRTTAGSPAAGTAGGPVLSFDPRPFSGPGAPQQSSFLTPATIAVPYGLNNATTYLPAYSYGPTVAPTYYSNLYGFDGLDSFDLLDHKKALIAVGLASGLAYLLFRKKRR